MDCNIFYCAFGAVKKMILRLCFTLSNFVVQKIFVSLNLNSLDISWLILHFDFVYRDYQIYRDEALCLEGRAPFAEGGNRVCFVHPDDEGLCVKVVKAGSVAALRGKRSFWKNLRPDSYFDDNLNEYNCLLYTSPSPRDRG